MSRIALVVLATLTLSTTSSQAAAPITHSFSANVDFITATDSSGADISAAFEAFLPFGLGASTDGSLTYDADVPDAIPGDSTFGMYDHQTGAVRDLSWSIAGLAFDDVAGEPFDTNVIADNTLQHSVTTFTDNVLLPTGWNATYAAPAYISMHLDLVDMDKTALSDDSLPASLSLADFQGPNDEVLFYLELVSPVFDPGDVTLTIDGQDFTAKSMTFGGTLTRLTPVPEPSTLALAAIGLLGLVFYGRRRRR